MENRCGVCPNCGGWLIVDGDYVLCDTCGAEWYDGKQTEKGFSDEEELQHERTAES